MAAEIEMTAFWNLIVSFFIFLSLFACAPEEVEKLKLSHLKRSVGKLGKVTIGDVIDREILLKIGEAPPVAPDKDFDPLLVPYIDSFLTDAKKFINFEGNDELGRLRTVHLVDKLTHQDNPQVISTCTRFVHETRSLDGSKVDEVNWKSIEILKDNNFVRGIDMRLKLVMYHELFHCIFDKGHLADSSIGIMTPVLDVLIPYLPGKWDKLVEELFSKNNFDATPDI